MRSAISASYVIKKLESGGFISANGRFLQSTGIRGGWYNVDLMNADSSQDYQIDIHLLDEIKKLVDLREERFDIGNTQLIEYRLNKGVGGE